MTRRRLVDVARSFGSYVRQGRMTATRKLFRASRPLGETWPGHLGGGP